MDIRQPKSNYDAGTHALEARRFDRSQCIAREVPPDQPISSHPVIDVEVLFFNMTSDLTGDQRPWRPAVWGQGLVKVETAIRLAVRTVLGNPNANVTWDRNNMFLCGDGPYVLFAFSDQVPHTPHYLGETSYHLNDNAGFFGKLRRSRYTTVWRGWVPYQPGATQVYCNKGPR